MVAFVAGSAEHPTVSAIGHQAIVVAFDQHDDVDRRLHHTYSPMIWSGLSTRRDLFGDALGLGQARWFSP